MSEFNMKRKQAISVPKRTLFKITTFATYRVSGIFIITKKHREKYA
ncbi:unknown [Alistipes sp. CAG:831]|nr:unknown [Alistipes sp. CAG:831]